MAEKYGEVPPKFTKKWWEYFWDYYKWHVIITVVAVLIASVTIVQCATRPKYDMNVVYAGHMNYSEEEINKLKEIISERISDIDGNGESSVLLSTLVFADNAGSEEYDYAIQTKLDLTFTDDCSFIYLMDKANVDAQLQKEVVDQIYDCTDTFIDSSSDKVVKAADGKGYAVNLKDSKLLKDNGIYCDDLYILIRRNYKDDEKNTQAHDDSIAVAEALVK